MGVSVLVLGVSGTGKSSSLRNFGADEIALVNVAGKPLPFKGKFRQTLNSDDYDDIKEFIRNTGTKPVAIDDAQYLMGNEFMRRALEKGYDKFTELAKNFFELLTFIQSLPDGKIVYLLGHIERDQDGNEKFKTMGKLIDQCINVEGTCTIVLKTCVSDGRYTFLTQNSGHDTVKSPMGMFPSLAIENDLKYVDEKIRNYYEFDGAVSDKEMAEKDKIVATDVTEDEARGKKTRRSSSRRSKKDEQPEEIVPSKAENGFMNIPDGVDEELPFDEAIHDAEPETQKGRRGRRTKAVDTDDAKTESKEKEEMTGAKAAFDKAKAKYGTDSSGTEERIPDDAETPAAPVPRRTRRVRK